MRTFGREAWNDSQRQWREGEFGPEWRNVRHQAAMRGMIYPPSGSRFDSWEDEKPSQRAIVYRAIQDTPTMLSELIATSSSWSQVVDKLIRRIAEWREDVAMLERNAEPDEDPTPRQALESLSVIFERMRDSVAR